MISKATIAYFILGVVGLTLNMLSLIFAGSTIQDRLLSMVICGCAFIRGVSGLIKKY